MLKPKLLKVAPGQSSSFDIRYEKLAYFDNPWHYHSECELTLVTSSSGIRFVGDCVENFEEGDLVLLGSHLPHYWRNHEAYYAPASSLPAEAYILRFSAAIVHAGFELPETAGARQLLAKAARGIWFEKAVATKVQPLLHNLLHSSGMESAICFLQIMQALSETMQYRILSSKAFGNTRMAADEGRINKVLHYITANMQHDIPLQLMAQQVNMNPAAFCRYIKNKTNKTFLELLNDIRISNACRMLLDGDRPVGAVAGSCGFRNVTHFNYTFRKITRCSPSAYRQQWKKKNANQQSYHIN